MAVKFVGAVIDGQPVMRRASVVGAGQYDLVTQALLTQLAAAAGADINTGNAVVYTLYRQRWSDY